MVSAMNFCSGKLSIIGERFPVVNLMRELIINQRCRSDIGRRNSTLLLLVVNGISL